MSPQLVQRLLNSAPFIPFHLLLTDGRAIAVSAVEVLSWADDGQALSLFDPPETVEYIDPAHVVSIKVREPLE